MARPPRPDGPGAAPVSVKPRVEVRDVGGRLQMTGSLDVALAKGADVDELTVAITMACLAREEDGVSSKDPIRVDVDRACGLERDGDRWIGDLSRDTPLEIAVTSEPYDPA